MLSDWLVTVQRSGLQIVFADVTAGDDETAYEELKGVIRGCLDLSVTTRSTAQQVQERLFSIMQQRGWGHDLQDDPSQAEGQGQAQAD